MQLRQMACWPLNCCAETERRNSSDLKNGNANGDNHHRAYDHCDNHDQHDHHPLLAHIKYQFNGTQTQRQTPPSELVCQVQPHCSNLSKGNGITSLYQRIRCCSPSPSHSPAPSLTLSYTVCWPAHAHGLTSKPDCVLCLTRLTLGLL